MSFSIIIYYASIIYFFLIILFLHFGKKSVSVKEQLFLLIPPLTIYYIIMTRSAGVDIPNYFNAYMYDPLEIPDLLFQKYYIILKYYEIPFWFSNLFIGFVNSICLIYFSYKKFPKYIFIVFFIFFCHLIVVRDFAQLRISLAFSFFILALVQKNRLFKFLLVFVSLGIHKSLLVIVVSYFLASKISRLNAPKRHTFLFFSIVSSVLLYFGVSYLFFIDARIEIYLNWDKDGYGNPVSSFGSVIFQTYLILLYVIIIGFKNMTSNKYILLTFFGFMIFVAFSPTAIFAFRLSNLVWSFYPFLIIEMLMYTKKKYKTSNAYLLSFIIIILPMIFFLNRPGTFSIIQSIKLW